MNLNLFPLVNKARRPKFEVHLKIYDLNNVPLVHGASHIKWHLPHSIHSDHRGRTSKCPIAHHRVEYNYSKLIPVRIAIDKNNALSECLVEFEIIQEFSSSGSTTHHAGSGGATGGVVGAAAGAAASAVTSSSGRDEKITLGRLTLNLAEYVEESEAIMRDSHGFRGGPMARHGSGNSRGSLDDNNKSEGGPHPPSTSADLVEEGIIRRYLLTDAKINSTLKISLLLVQLDGERAYTAPPLKTAGAVFGGGILGGGGAGGSGRPGGAEDFGQHFQDVHPEQDAANLSAAAGGGDAAGGGGNNSTSRDAAAARHEVQDVYRRALAASWACQPGELPADECIEDIFSGGDGFGDEGSGSGVGSSRGDVTPRSGGNGSSSTSLNHQQHQHASHHHRQSPSKRMTLRREDSGSSSTGDGGNDFLRPGTAGTGLKRNGAGGGSGRSRMRGHMRQGSGESVSTLRINNNNNDGRPGSSGGASAVGVGGGGSLQQQRPPGSHRRDGSKDSNLQRGGVLGADGGMGMRRSSLASLSSLAGSTMESERGRGAFKSAREVTEREVREDFVAWKLPGTA